MNNIFQFGFYYTVAGYDIYLGEILLAVVALVLFAVLSIRGVKFTGVFQTLLVFALVAGVAIVAIAACVSDKASFENLKPAFYPSSSTGAKIGGCLQWLQLHLGHLLDLTQFLKQWRDLSSQQRKQR